MISAPPFYRWLKHPYLFVTLFLMLFRFWPFFIGKTLFFGDNYSLMVPGKLFTASFMREGVFPLWNPYLFTGISWIGDLNQSLFSFSTVFFWLLEPVAAVNLTILFHCALTTIGMMLLANIWTKSQWAGLAAGALWVFSPIVSNALQNISVLQSIAWVPFVLLFGLFYRKSFWGTVATAMALGQMLLGGYPQWIPYTLGLALILSLYLLVRDGTLQTDWKSWIREWGLIGLLTLGLTAFAWLPFVSTLQNSTRSIQTLDQATHGSLKSHDLLSILLPSVFSDPGQGILWGPGWNDRSRSLIYLPWIGIVLIVQTFRTRKTADDLLFAILTLGSVLIAFGQSFPFFRVFLTLVPMFGASRTPTIALIIPTILMCLWLPQAALQLRNGNRMKRILPIVWFLWIGIALGLLLLPWFFTPLWDTVNAITQGRLAQSAFHTLEIDQIIGSHIAKLLFFQFLFFGLALWVWKRRWFQFLFAVFVVEMAFVSSSVLFFAPSSVWPTWKEIYEQRVRAPASLITPDRALIRNGNVPYTDFSSYWDALTVRKPFSDSYIDEQERREFNHLKRLRQTSTPDWNMVYRIPSLNGYAAFVPVDVNARWNNTGTPALNSLPEILPTDPKLPHWGVAYELVDTWFPHAQESVVEPLYTRESLQVIKRPSLSRFRLQNGKEIHPDNITQTPNEQIIRIEEGNGASLIIADRFDPDWTVKINGQVGMIRPFEGMREIPLLAGNSDVHLRYEPQTWRVGRLITGLTLVIVISSSVFVQKRVRSIALSEDVYS